MIRFLRFAYPYPAFVRQLYRRNPGLAHRSFDDQGDVLKTSLFPGATDAIELSLLPHGFDCRLYHLNVRAVQHAWWKLHGAGALVRKRWMLQIARAQVLQFRPHVLFIDPFAVPVGWISELRRDCTSIRVVMYRYSSPREDLTPFRECDLIVSGDEYQVDELRAMGLNGQLLHHAFDKRVLDVLPPVRDEQHEVLFSGQLIQREGFHHYRAGLLHDVIQAGIPLSLYLLAPDTDARARYKIRIRKVLSKAAAATRRVAPEPPIGRWMRKFGMGSPPPPPIHPVIRQHARAPLFGRELYAEMAKSKVCLNVHGDVSHSDANNIRLWEAAGVGSCLLTDYKRNLHRLFRVGSEVIAYDSVPDCIEKASWLLTNHRERQDIGRAGRERVLKFHTYEHRAVELKEFILKAMS